MLLAKWGEMPALAPVTVLPAGSEEVRVCMVASGICPTDFNAIRDARPCPALEQSGP